MAYKLDLAPDEVVILESTGISHGGALAGYTDDLILTNHSLIHLKKGLFGSVKATTRYPLSDIKVFNEQAQAKLGKQQNGSPQLEVFFVNGVETFGFQFKKDVVKFVESINKIITGRDFKIDTGRLAIPGTELIAKTLKGTFDTAKEAFGIKSKEDVKIGIKCPSCGGPVDGYKGETKKCPYCSNFISF